MGKIRTPHYRIIVADARNKRDGRAIEEIGLYNPKVEPSYIKLDSERVQYWLSVGAQPTVPVAAILKVTGDWQKFKGLPGAEGTLKVAEPKGEKRAAFDAALAEVHGEAKSGATTPKKKSAKKNAPKAEAKADDKAEAKADDKAEAKADDKAEAKADDKAKAKADETAEQTPETKADAPAAEASTEES